MKTTLNRLLKVGRANHLTTVQSEAVRDFEKYSPKKLENPDTTPEIQIYSKEELKALQRYLIDNPDGRYANLLLLITVTGIRVGEAVALRVDDFTDDTVRIRKQERRTGTRYEIVPFAKTDASRRDVVVPTAWQWLLPQITKTHTEDGYIAVSRWKTRATTDAIRMRLRRVCEAAGIEYKSPHKIRKTVATAMRGVVDDETIIRQLGHESINVTRESYYRGSWQGTEDVVRKLNQVPALDSLPPENKI